MKKIIPYSSATILAAFGLLTLFLSSSVILDLFGVREREGNYVLFIVWANFFSSLLYLYAAFGFIKGNRWTVIALAISSILLIVAFIGLQIYISEGGIHETKTVSAMMFRITVTVIFAAAAYFTLPGTKINVE